MADMNRMLRLAQSTGGSPYDESTADGGTREHNYFLNERLRQKINPLMQDYIIGWDGNPRSENAVGPNAYEVYGRRSIANGIGNGNGKSSYQSGHFNGPDAEEDFYDEAEARRLRAKGLSVGVEDLNKYGPVTDIAPNSTEQQSRTNHWLNKRLDNRMLQQSTGDGYNSGFWGNMHRQMSERIPNMMTPPGYEDRLSQPQPAPAGSDIDMMQMYGPEDQVAYDGQGNPIPLADPRHPMNQRGQMPSGAAPMYPQRR